MLKLERDVCDDDTLCVALDESIKKATEAAEYYQKILKKVKYSRGGRVPEKSTMKGGEVRENWVDLPPSPPLTRKSSDSATEGSELSMTEQIENSSVIVADKLAELEDIIQEVGALLTKAEENDTTSSPGSLSQIKFILIRAEGLVDAVGRELRRFEDRGASGHLSRLEYELGGLTVRFERLGGAVTSQSRVHTSSASPMKMASSSSSSGTLWSDSGKSYSLSSSNWSYGSSWYDTNNKAPSSQSSGIKVNVEDELFQKELEMAMRMSMQEAFPEEAGIDSSSREVKHRNSEDFYDLPLPSAEAINIMSQFNSNHTDYNQTTENIKDDEDDEEEKEKEKEKS